MVQRHPCTAVDMTFFESAPFVYVAEEDVAVPAEILFASLESADDWPCWARPIKRVEWTSSKPFGIGTTRTVYMLGGMTGYEEFIAWERGREMAFCFTHASKPNVESFAERYEVTPVDHDHCRVRWTMAMKPKGIGKYFMPIFSPAMGMGVRWMLRGLRCLLERRRGVAQQQS